MERTILGIVVQLRVCKMLMISVRCSSTVTNYNIYYYREIKLEKKNLKVFNCNYDKDKYIKFDYNERRSSA